MSTPANVNFPTGHVLTYSHDGYPSGMTDELVDIVEAAEARKVGFKDGLRLEILERSDDPYGPTMQKAGGLIPRADYTYKVDEDGEIFVSDENDNWVPIDEYVEPYEQ